MTGFAAFGKMPSLGDFFRINAAPSFVTPWDHWLQTGLAASRVTLGGRWNDCYMSAPIWRFSLAPGLAGPHAIMGVLMPSIDRVGRKYPLTLFHTVAGDAATAHRANASVFAALEDIALATLDDDASRSALAAALGALPAPHSCPSTRTESRQSHWTAQMDNTQKTAVFSGLPTPHETTHLFDLSAVYWQRAGDMGVSV